MYNNWNCWEFLERSHYLSNVCLPVLLVLMHSLDHCLLSEFCGQFLPICLVIRDMAWVCSYFLRGIFLFLVLGIYHSTGRYGSSKPNTSAADSKNSSKTAAAEGSGAEKSSGDSPRNSQDDIPFLKPKDGQREKESTPSQRTFR